MGGGFEPEDLKMKRFALAATAVVAACMFATPTLAGSNNQDGYYYHWQPQNHQYHSQNRYRDGDRQRDRAEHYGMSVQEYRALQARKECQTFAFMYWRYHPDYQHCGYN
jgi:hypothetical protein